MKPSLFLLLLAGSALAAEPRRVFSDEFERAIPGEAWRSTTGNWSIENGALLGSENPADGHGAVTQTYLDFSDLILEFRFRLGDSPSFNLVFDDRHYDGSHAGHICRLAVSRKQIRIGDDKTGAMENAIFAMRRDPLRKADAEKLLEGKQQTIPIKLEADRWYTLRASIAANSLTVHLDGKELGSLTSPGIRHFTKTDFGFTVKGPGVRFDEVRAALPHSTGDTWIYGASSQRKEVVVARHQRQPEGDAFTVVQKLPIGLSAGPMTHHPDHALVYVADTRPKADGGARGYVFTVQEDGQLGSPRKVEFHHGYSYLSLDRTRRFLLCTSYREGHVDVYKLDENGLPGKRVSTRFEGRDKAHSILASPDNRHVYVPYVKDQNAVHQYAFDDKTGTLTPLKTASIEPPNGSGPRHIAFHPSRPFVFFSNEQQVGASSYRRARNGELKFHQLCDVLAGASAEGQSASDIALTRGGRFLFTGMRSRGNGINGVNRYAVESDGSLRHLGRAPTGAVPWCIQLSPDEQRLFATTTSDGLLTSFTVGEDGELTKTGAIEWGKNFRDLVVLDDP